MTSHFKLYCDRSIIRKYALITPFFASLLGITILSYIADTYGRKVALFYGHLLMTFVSLLIPTVDDPYF